jgi:flagellar biosynthetic protein FliR
MLGQLVAAFLVFSRLGGLLMAMPGFTAGTLPSIARLGAALPLTLVLLPGAGQPAIPGSVPALAGAVIMEAGIGLAMGMCVSMVFGAFTMAAEIMGAKMGINLASLLDPMTGSTQGGLGVLASWLGVGVFFATDTHASCIVALGESLQAVPPGTFEHPLRAGAVLFEVATAVTASAVQLAGPVIAVVMVVNLAIMLLGRMAPNLQLFYAIGPGVTLVVGFVVLGAALPSLMAIHAEELGGAPGWMRAVLAVTRPG